MNERQLYARVGIILLLIIFSATIWLSPKLKNLNSEVGNFLTEFLGQGSCPKEKLCVTFLDVGQGDATLIESPTGTQLLIDGGRGSAILRELGAVMGFWDRDLDFVLATHPDADHIGGLVDVLKRYQVKNFIRNDNASDTPVYKLLESLINKEGRDVFYARRGQQYDLGAGVKFEILFPEIEMKDAESNTSSIVGKLTYGSSTFILTGDSPKSIEEYLVLTEGENLQSQVLKVGHHGSRTSTSELFLEEVAPTYAVISSGKDNQYGHPHLEVIDLLFNKRVETFNTAEVGRVMFISDGVNLVFK